MIAFLRVCEHETHNTRYSDPSIDAEPVLTVHDREALRAQSYHNAIMFSLLTIHSSEKHPNVGQKGIIKRYC